MRHLLVAATEAEIAPLLNAMTFREDISPNVRFYEYGERQVDVLVTGVGMTATAAWVSRALAQREYGCAINAGICGSFDRTVALGEVVRVQTDRMPELGAEDGERFLDIHALNLLGENEFPFHEGVLPESALPVFGSLLQLKPVSGITVNKVHGNEKSIEELVKRCSAQTESMEGAAFYYACAIAGVPALQVRAVSNYVEKRNREAWKIGEAVKNLNAALLDYIAEQ